MNLGDKILGVKDNLQARGQRTLMWLSYKEIGERVTAIRLGLPGSPSRAAFAKLLGREGSASTIGNIERGCERSWKHGPNEKLLREIASLGGLPIGHFQTGDVRNLERQEKLAVLRWLNKVADDLEKEVDAIPVSVGDFVGDVEAESVRPRMARGKKGGDGRP